MAALWAENVVDDVSLEPGPARLAFGVEVPRGARLYTRLEGETLGDWSRWLTRQWLYMKFCMLRTWLASGLVVHLLVALGAGLGDPAIGPLCGSGFRDPANCCGGAVPGRDGLAGDRPRALHPSPGPRRAVAGGVFGGHGHGQLVPLAVGVHQGMLWRGIAYRVGWRGRVIEVSRDLEQAEAND